MACFCTCALLPVSLVTCIFCFVGSGRTRPYWGLGLSLLQIELFAGLIGTLLLALDRVTLPRLSGLVVTPAMPILVHLVVFSFQFPPPFKGFGEGSCYCSCCVFFVVVNFPFSVFALFFWLCFLGAFSLLSIPCFAKVFPAHSQGTGKGYQGCGGIVMCGHSLGLE